MSLEKNFIKPDSSYSQVPLWYWNHRPTRQILSWQIEQMKEKGIGGFIICARPGLAIPYLSDEWFECIRFCCEKANDFGMLVWVSDRMLFKNLFPDKHSSGEQSNELSLLHMVQEELQGPASITFTEDVQYIFTGADGKDYRRLQCRDWQVPEGKWKLVKIVKSKCPSSIHMDLDSDVLMNFKQRGSVDRVVDLYHEKLGDLNSMGLAGFFIDNQSICCCQNDNDYIPWMDNLPDVFMEEKGYDIQDHLVELFCNNNAGIQIQHDFYDIITKLFAEVIFKPISRWCEDNKIQLACYIPCTKSPFSGFIRPAEHCSQKDLFVPAVACVYRKANDDNLTLNTTLKKIVSTALFEGQEKIMGDIQGESGWGFSLSELKWITDCHVVNGVNYILPHAFHYSVAGKIIKDPPPSEFYQAPFWPHYDQYADYTARLTSVVTGGEHIAKIAVLYPDNFDWANHVHGDDSPDSTQDLGKTFYELCNTLQGMHRDYLIVEERDLALSEVQGNRFIINTLQFEGLVIPQTASMHQATFDVVQKISEDCLVLSINNSEMLLTQHGNSGEPVDPQQVIFRDCKDIKHLDEVTNASLSDSLARIKPDVIIEGIPDIHYLHKLKDGKDFYFISNTSQNEVNTIVSFETVGAAEIWNPENGTIIDANGQKGIEGRLSVPLNLTPQGSCLVAIDTSQEIKETQQQTFTSAHRIRLCDLWHFTPLNGNFCQLRDWQMHIETKNNVTTLRYMIDFILNEPIANMRLILDGIPRHPEGSENMANKKILQESTSSIYLNGELLNEELPWEIDPEFRVLHIAQRLDADHYRLQIEINNHGALPQHGLEEYVWLAGDFSLDLSDGIPRLSAVRGLFSGPWEEHGFPYFSGTGAYMTEFDMPKDTGGKRIFLDAGRVGNLLAIEINGKEIAVKAWPPYRTEVTEYIKSGHNLFVLKVSNTSKNFMEGPDKEMPSGLLDEVCLEIER